MTTFLRAWIALLRTFLAARRQRREQARPHARQLREDPLVRDAEILAGHCSGVTVENAPRGIDPYVVRRVAREYLRLRGVTD